MKSSLFPEVFDAKGVVFGRAFGFYNGSIVEVIGKYWHWLDSSGICGFLDDEIFNKIS